MFYINKDAHLKIPSATLPGCFFPNCCTAVVKIPLTFLTSTVSFDNSSSTIHAWSLSESGGDQFSFWYSFLASGNPKINVLVNLVFLLKFLVLQLIKWRHYRSVLATEWALSSIYIWRNYKQKNQIWSSFLQPSVLNITARNC